MRRAAATRDVITPSESQSGPERWKTGEFLAASAGLDEGTAAL